MKPAYVRRSTCRVCPGLLIDVLDLGEHYLSGFHDPGADKGPKVPLVLTRCEKCGLVQLRDTTDPDLLFRDRYWYRSDVNETMKQALADIAHEAEEIVDLQPGETVLDIGANVGTLLLSYSRPNIKRVAFEPASNLSGILEDLYERDFLSNAFYGYFSANTYLRLGECDPARVVTAIAMVYDLDRPLSFLHQVKRVLAPDGLFIVQMSYLGAMFDNGGYDVICHEHLETWSSNCFANALEDTGLRCAAIRYNDVNGGSARYYITHAEAADPDFSMISAGVEGHETWIDPRDPNASVLADFANNARQNRDDLLKILYDLKRNGKSVFALAASTKFNTVLQYCGIGPDLITAIADRDPRKHGKVTPTNIPIISEERARSEEPDVMVLGAWQFKDMLIEREADYLKSGGAFLVPFPTPHFVTWADRGED